MFADKTCSPVLIESSSSPYARLRLLPLNAVVVQDTFWAPRRQINRQVTLPAQYRAIEETGRLDNFRRAAGDLKGPFHGRYYNDSDVYKWLEAAAWTLATDDDPALAGMVSTAVEAIAAAQEPDGYLHTYFTFERAGERWGNLRDMHELYCAGHLIQAAVAHFRTTGSERLLAVACRLADHIGARFGPAEQGKLPGVPGHQEIEMALVELARTTGEQRYRELAQFFLDARGRGLIGGRAYHQDHRPFRELDQLTGHAVRALYMNVGAADLYAETGEAALRETLERLWTRMVQRQIYISGGLGARHDGEAFGGDFELPNMQAYAETCAAIASAMWNQRMLLLAGEARYADLLEHTLYNAVLPGISLDGLSYFYPNPLASDGSHRRQSWFDCACCPTNIVRLLASLPGYFYSLSGESSVGEAIWVHMYAAGRARVPLWDGRTVELVQRTGYPWSGEVEIEVLGEGTFGLHVRLPGWCEEPSLEINGRPWGGSLPPSSYVKIERVWRPGDIVRLFLPMPPRRVVSHPYVADNTGRVALLRGPLLYCLEQADNPGIELRDICLPADLSCRTTTRPDGMVLLRFPARVIAPGEHWAECLYRTSDDSDEEQPVGPVELTALPYYAWANREPGSMQVWLRQ